MREFIARLFRRRRRPRSAADVALRMRVLAMALRYERARVAAAAEIRELVLGEPVVTQDPRNLRIRMADEEAR
ncbi:MAG TPA: hypothetical protein VGR87_03910 [Candidatus Limnocylindria bacterium]|jgi:hypothetical protein|nr:hypothetical protein [Candidatus Limnocylindria bacterium]